ncbi:CoaE-domain-containing protein [Phellopilus nigrolimitatus]|nr:CoaE-domain-containing protein [Phellopilus nigrolimitatus]
MPVVGLTGGIATGKSTVSSLFKSHSVMVVDADIIARQVVLPGTRTHSQIVAYFGNGILHPDGSLDRPKLGAVIFGDEQKRRQLNSIVHPAVRRAMLWEVIKGWVRGERYCVIDVPLLIETGLYKCVGKVIVASCSEDMQLMRLMSRDNLSEEDAMARIKSQMPITEKAKYADAVIDNSGTLDELREQVQFLIRKLESETRWTWLLEWVVPPLGLVSAVLMVMARAIKQFTIITNVQTRKKQ